jgi:hypothetical protein
MRPISAHCLALLASSLLAWTTPVAAQICGDADASGAVTVTDGVQTLRAAAGLSSSCTTAACDVDGSGSVTVTDGVNVLRKAAGLSAPSACPGAQSNGVTEAVDAVVPFFAFGFVFASDVTVAGAVAPAGVDVDDCPNGGTRTKDFTGAVLRIEFNACKFASPGLGSFQFDRRILINFVQSQIAFSFDVTDLGSGNVVDFNGLFAFTPRAGGGFTANGAITLVTPQGDFSLVVDQIEVDDEGHVLSGAGSIRDSAQDQFDLDVLTFETTGPGTAEIVATFDDGSTSRFDLNLITGDLTPA